MKKAIFVVGQWSRAGGLEIVTQDYVHVFRELGFDVAVYATSGEGPIIREKYFEVEFLEPSFRLLKRVWHRGYKFRSLGRRISRVLSSGDVLVIGHPYLMPLFAHAEIPSGVICWLWTHGIDAWGNRPREWGRWQNALTRIIAVSGYTADQERKAGITRPISIVSNCIDINRFTPDGDLSNVRRNEVLISSRLTEDTRNKGHDVLFAAVPYVERKLGRNICVRVIGSGGDLEYVKSMAEKLCPGRVSFMGRVSDDDLLEAYRHCGVFCMPSRVEYIESKGTWRGDGFGLVYAEAQACGRPVIGSIEGGAVDPIEEGVTGYKVNPRDVQAVADAIVKILADPDLADRMGAAGRKLVEMRFSPDAYKIRIRELLRSDGVLMD